jgi:hypothetical protein
MENKKDIIHFSINIPCMSSELERAKHIVNEYLKGFDKSLNIEINVLENEITTNTMNAIPMELKSTIKVESNITFNQWYKRYNSLDFSRLRNDLSSVSQGYYIIQHDSDEQMTINNEFLLDMLEANKDYYYGHVVTFEMEKETQIFKQVRVFKRSKKYAYLNKIHETLGVFENDTFLSIPLIFNHFGYYDKETNTQKALRNIELMVNDYKAKELDKHKLWLMLNSLSVLYENQYFADYKVLK